MSRFDPDMAAHIQEALEAYGVRVHLHAPLQAIARRGRGLVVISGAGEIATDLVIVALGTRPRSALAEAAGIPLGETGAVAVNTRQETRVPGVYAAGDCAEVFHLARGAWANLAMGTIANKAGRVAGINLAGGEATFPGVAGTAISRIGEVEVARTGLNEGEAAAAGIAVRANAIRATSRVGYMPHAGWIHVKVLAEAGTDRIVGGQIVGTEAAAKRIDVLATAIQHRLTLRDVVDLDLGYTPAISPVWDPVQTACRTLIHD